MNRETIEKAMKNAVQARCQCNWEYSCEGRDYCEFCNGHNSAFDCDENCDADAFSEGFIAGARWCINSVWHDIDKERPMPGEHVVNEDWFDFAAEDWKDLERILKKYPFKRWAYVADLLPGGEEDEQ